AMAMATGLFRMANLGRTITACVPPEGPRKFKDPRAITIETSAPIIPHSRLESRVIPGESPISTCFRLFSFDIRLTQLVLTLSECAPRFPTAICVSYGDDVS